MAPESEKPRCSHPESKPARRVARGRRVVRKIAQGTLFAAGLAAAQFGLPESEPKVPLFSRTLIDKLHEPISRHHE
jgi:hypothetical protein